VAKAVGAQAGSMSGRASVARKLFAVMQDIEAVGRLAKGGFNQAQSYKYLSESQVKELMQPLLVKHGLLFVPLNQSITAVHEPKDGGKQRVTCVSVVAAFMCAETGEAMTVTYIGSGADSQDKGVYKALTGAGKQLFCNMFQIPTGDDPEKDASDRQQRVSRASEATGTRKQNPESVITQPQANRMFGLMNKAGKSAEQVKAIAAKFGYQSSKEIRVKDYDKICEEIEAL
jgi:hypothetical protein